MVPPAAEHGSFMEFVRSKTITMWAGFGTPCPIVALAFAVIVQWSSPSTFANVVGTTADCLTTSAFTGLHRAVAMHDVVTAVVTGGRLPGWFLSL